MARFRAARRAPYRARAATVVVEADIELRWVDSGELAETMPGVAVFDVRDGHVRRFCPQPDLESALRVAGWTGRAQPHAAPANGEPNHGRSSDA